MRRLNDIPISCFIIAILSFMAGNEMLHFIQKNSFQIENTCNGLIPGNSVITDSASEEELSLFMYLVTSQYITFNSSNICLQTSFLPPEVSSSIWLPPENL